MLDTSSESLFGQNSIANGKISLSPSEYKESEPRPIGEYHTLVVCSNRSQVSFVVTQNGFIDAALVLAVTKGRETFPSREGRWAFDRKEEKMGRKLDERSDKLFKMRRIPVAVLDEVYALADSTLASFSEKDVKTVLVTGCSKKKASGSTCEAVKLYQSTRITFASRLAQKKGIPLFIVSAKYGLVGSDEVISDYDEIMSPEKAEHLIPTAIKQIQTAGIDKMVFFSAGVNKHYKTLLEKACHACGVTLEIIGTGCMGGAKELPFVIDDLKNNHCKKVA